ncbi:MAG: serine hydrolase domain-containing protein [Promethearchaeota archaeon]
MKFDQFKLKSSTCGLFFILVIIFCFKPSFTAANINGFYFPDKNWDVTIPEQQGMDSKLISKLYTYIKEESLDIQSVLITRNGYLIEEKFLHSYEIIEGDQFHSDDSFWTGLLIPVENIRYNRLHALWSCTKSITSLLIGIAIDEGYFNITQTFFDIFPDRWKSSYGDEIKKNITVEHLLTMRAGLLWQEEVDSFFGWPATDFSMDYILNKPMTKLGESFIYSTGDTQLLSAILQNKTGSKASEFAREKLFAPIGIEDTEWEWDETNWEWGSGNISFGGFGLFMTPRAMARIGLLCLNNGTWKDRQIVPKEWIKTATSNLVGNPAYGYLFWLSEYFYSAMGFLGQRIIIISEFSIVIVFTAGEINDIDDNYEDIVNNYILDINGSDTDTSSNGTSDVEMLPLLAAVVVLASIYKYKRNKKVN